MATRRTLVLLAILAAVLPTPGLLAQGPAEVPYELAALDGLTMAYRELGAGGPLVLLHGFGASGMIWNGVLDDLAARYRVIVPDLRGHGRSTNPSGTFTHRQAAKDVYALLDTLGIDRIRAMGSSTGAMTLLHMATSRPRRIEAMVLIAGTHYFPESARRIMRSVSPEDRSMDSLQEQARRMGHVRGAEQMRELDRLFDEMQDSYDDMNFTPPYLSTIDAATLIVHGDRDPFFPIKIPVELYESIPDSYLWIVPDTGHSVLLWTERGRARLVETVLDFLPDGWEREDRP